MKPTDIDTQLINTVAEAIGMAIEQYGIDPVLDALDTVLTVPSDDLELDASSITGLTPTIAMEFVRCIPTFKNYFFFREEEIVKQQELRRQATREAREYTRSMRFLADLKLTAEIKQMAEEKEKIKGDAV